MTTRIVRLGAFMLLTVSTAMMIGSGCPMGPIDGGGIPDVLAVTVYATNTGGASGMAVRPSDGALFIVNNDGLFGPITEGEDVSKLDALGAENIGGGGIFDTGQSEFVLAITEAGEFWIASPCCGTLGVVAKNGGDAVVFQGLTQPPVNAVTALNIFPTALVIVPANADSTVFGPGDLLAGNENAFSRLAAIVVATREVRSVANPIGETPPPGVDRFAYAMVFDADGTLFTSRQSPSLSAPGLQQIAANGSPSAIAGTEGVAAQSFVLLPDGDFLIRGTHALSAATSFSGMLLFNPDNGAVTDAFDIADGDTSSGDELLMLPDGTVLMSQPELNRIVAVAKVK